MIRKVFTLILGVIVPYTAHASLETPKKNKNTLTAINFFSPDRPRIDFEKFRMLLINALQQGNIKNFHQLFSRFFSTIVYPMQIKTKEFYASLFYIIFQEIILASPFHESNENFEKITIFVENQNGQYFAIEVFIYSQGDEDNDDEDSNDKQPYITPESINETHAYGFVYPGLSMIKAKTIRLFLDVSNNRTLIIDALDTSELKHFRIINPEDCATLHTYGQSPMHTIIYELDNEEPNFDLIQENLEIFYNSIPGNLTHPYREKTCEKYYHSLFYTMLNFLRFNGYAYTEVYTSEGRADILINTTLRQHTVNRPTVIELKHNKSAKKALNQIRERRYLRSVSHSNDCKPLMIGINIKTSKDSNRITVSKIEFAEYGDTTTPLRQTKIKPSFLSHFLQFDIVGSLDFSEC